MKTLHLLCLTSFVYAGCGGGMPVRITVDEVVFDVDIDNATTNIEKQLRSSGFIPAETLGIPELWPESLPDVRWISSFTTKPQKVDIKDQIDKYSKYTKVIERIELNKVIVRIERNNTTIPIPSMKLQMATDPETSPSRRVAWQTIGEVKEAPMGFTGDLTLDFLPGGETLLYNQISDDEKDFAIRALGSVVFDTEKNNKRPGGQAKARFIAVLTVFLAPDNFLK